MDAAGGVEAGGSTSEVACTATAGGAAPAVFGEADMAGADNGAGNRLEAGDLGVEFAIDANGTLEAGGTGASASRDGSGTSTGAAVNADDDDAVTGVCKMRLAEGAIANALIGEAVDAATKAG